VVTPSTTINSSASAPALTRQDVLIRNIKAHIAKGENARERADQNHKRADNHFVSAGQYLALLKEEHAGSWSEWELLLKTRVGISAGRASELMAIGSGTKTVEQVRADTNARKRKYREALRSTPAWNEGEVDFPDFDNEEPESVATTPLVARAALGSQGPEVPTKRQEALRLIDGLIDQGIRETATRMVLNGERQNDFESVTNAVADFYHQLSRAGR
jgi:hypothetical protein